MLKGAEAVADTMGAGLFTELLVLVPAGTKLNCVEGAGLLLCCLDKLWTCTALFAIDGDDVTKDIVT